jgi:hypothetical protein
MLEVFNSLIFMRFAINHPLFTVIRANNFSGNMLIYTTDTFSKLFRGASYSLGYNIKRIQFKR